MTAEERGWENCSFGCLLDKRGNLFPSNEGSGRPGKAICRNRSVRGRAIKFLAPAGEGEEGQLIVPLIQCADCRHFQKRG